MKQGMRIVRTHRLLKATSSRQSAKRYGDYRITHQSAGSQFVAYSRHRSGVLIDRHKRACRSCRPIATNHDNTASSLRLPSPCDEASKNAYIHSIAIAGLDSF